MYYSLGDKKVRLTLTISDIDQEMLHNTYECVVTRLDVYSVYNQTLHKYNLHTTDTRLTATHHLLSKPGVTDEDSIRHYRNGTKGVCTRDKLCTASVIFQLQPPTSECSTLGNEFAKMLTT